MGSHHIIPVVWVSGKTPKICSTRRVGGICLSIYIYIYIYTTDRLFKEAQERSHLCLSEGSWCFSIVRASEHSILSLSNSASSCGICAVYNLSISHFIRTLSADHGGTHL